MKNVTSVCQMLCISLTELAMETGNGILCEFLLS